MLPEPLLAALEHVFKQGVSGCMLVGGTALAGFYAGHRRSDDLDLFTRSPDAQAAAALAVESLASAGAEVSVRQRSAQYFRALCALRGHRFTADVALHAGLFEIGRARMLENGVAVAELETLLMMKAAALVSRCAEKDLYDLLWILERLPEYPLSRLVELGLRLDAGADPEGLIIGVSGSEPREEACAFALEPPLTAKEVFRRVSAFRAELLLALRKLAEGQPPPAFGELIRRLRKAS